MSDLLTVQEVARRLQVSPRTVLRWIASGQLAAKSLPSGRKRIEASAVDELLDTQRIASP